MGSREKFCVIIPDRNDRPELTQFCFTQIDRMTVRPDYIYHINYKPHSNDFDLTERIHKGTQLAKADGFDICFIVENDDAYPHDYFERFTPHLKGYDFFGDDTTIYYHLGDMKYTEMSHPGRSSLFSTGFRISALRHFTWPFHDVYLDIHFWKHAKQKNKLKKFISTGAIGIKHGTGKCGGNGHKMKMNKPDPHMKLIKERLQAYHVEFYQSFKKKLLVQ